MVGFLCSPSFFCTGWVSSCILPVYHGGSWFFPLFVFNIFSVFTDKKNIKNFKKRVLTKLISKNQNTYVEGRQILDAVLVVNEAVDSIIRSKKSVVLCKLNFKKAYDHVDWSFLCSVMAKMGFGEK